MNESRRAKRLSPFEVLRNETLEFIDSLVKWVAWVCCSTSTEHYRPSHSRTFLLQELPSSAGVSAALRSLLLQFLFDGEAPPQRNTTHFNPVGAQQPLLLPSGTSAGGRQVWHGDLAKKETWSDSKISVFESTEHFIPLHSSFFQNESLKTEDGTVSNSAPDICIAYKLHLECGRLINLYDWLEVSAFVKWWCWGCAAPSELSPEQLCKLESLLSHNHRRPYWSWRINVSHDWPTVDRSLLSSRPILLLFRLQRETIRILKTPGKLTKSSSILQSASFLILLAPPCAC